MSAIPKNWKAATLGDVARSMKNGIYKPADSYADDGIVCLRMYNIDGGSIVLRDLKRMRLSPQEIEEYGLLTGDLLVNRVNSRELVGKTAVIPKSLGPAVFESKNIRVRLDDAAVNPRFVSLQVLQNGSKYFSGNAQQVVGMASISQTQIARFPVLVAPIQEQNRIVNKVDELLSDLDAGVVALERARVDLKRYRAAVLKAAVEGRLSEKWRAAHPEVEPASKLLERILAERRKRWEEAQLKKYVDREQAPPKKWKDKYPEPIEVGGVALPELPPGWCWATMDQLCWRIADADHKMPKGVADGVPYISTKDFFGANGIAFDKAKRISIADFEMLRKKIEPGRGDLLLSRYGTVGEVRWLKDPVPQFLASYSIACLKLSVLEIGEWLSVALRSNPVQRVLALFVRGVAQPDLGLAHIRELPIPLPPLQEQKVLGSEVARYESVMGSVEGEVKSIQVRGRNLRHAILKHAFDGKLVPQDPKDEPASELLARIRAGRGTGAAVEKKPAKGRAA